MRRPRWQWGLAAAAAVVLMVCGGVGLFVARSLGVVGCVEVDLTVPAPDEVRMGVTNATGVSGRELDVFVEFGQRGFQMLSTTSAAPLYEGVAVVRFGPATAGGAHLVRAYLRDRAEMEFSKLRRGDRIELVVGTQFAEVATVAEAEQELVRLGPLDPPPGACAT